ncbi:MAG: hypothetical protein M3429_10700 [Verrucomicrobiota bacterium]|jgi:hypothetical protein|nr:hypothetical protein [Verrucomicrobiota bacterium]
MPTDSTNPTWLEAPPPKKSGTGCAGKGCLFLAAFALLTLVLIGLGSYLLFSGGSKPTQLPIEELPPAQLAEVQERVEQFQAAPATPSYTPDPSAPTETGEATPEPASPTPEPGRKLTLSGSEINGLISANPKSRGHAYVSVSGNTATVQMSIESEKVPGFPKGYLNGSFTIRTDGPTPITGLQVSKIEANGFPVPSGILSMSVGGKSIMGYALEGAAPYNVSTAEIRDGVVILR